MKHGIRSLALLRHTLEFSGVTEVPRKVPGKVPGKGPGKVPGKVPGKDLVPSMGAQHHGSQLQLIKQLNLMKMCSHDHIQ